MQQEIHITYEVMTFLNLRDSINLKQFRDHLTNEFGQTGFRTENIKDFSFHLKIETENNIERSNRILKREVRSRVYSAISFFSSSIKFKSLKEEAEIYNLE